ncbi:MAG TPA: SPOR domain-containing protein [Bordetella sp.]|uniref:SPOR domain-containing protein n=1 Tax=Bordetella sp. TaxID=28081 RepID=UPI002ECFFAD9
MGLFTRRDSAVARKGEARRPPVSSEIQAAELRARARRRLAGSVILVLAAVIILPMVLDSRPAQVADDVSVRIPGKDTPYQPTVSSPQAQQPAQAAAPATQPAPDAADPAPATTAAASIPEAPAMADLQRSLAKPEPSKPEPKAQAKAEPKSAESRPAPVARTDDGSVAMALLEGRKPPVAAPAKPAVGAGGNYVLQIAAYSSQADAQSRYNKLRQAGITNAYLEPYTSGGKSQYRLRVGPFPSREAAQAAQARLRALGYDNGFIATK